MKISYSFGIIDLLHYGHLTALKKASENSDYNVFGLVSDEAAVAWQGSIVSSENERRAVLECIRYIDDVMPQRTFDPTENIKKLHKRYPEAKITLYHGSDMAVIPAELYLESIGGSVEIVEYYDKMSPMRILEILSEDKSKASKNANIISTKANTLISLKKRLKKSYIEDIYVCTVSQYKNNFENVFKEINDKFNGNKIVVRSSSESEDCYESSNAGHYESVLNVDSSDRNIIIDALDRVAASYINDDNEAHEQEQILIQRQTLDVAFSGVVFTRDIQNNRPYYVINYDDNGKTDTVTGGTGGKSLWIARDTEDKDIPKQWTSLLASVKEIEGVLNGALLDIEFAVKKDSSVVIFQVRPLAANYKYSRNKNNNAILDLKNKTIDKYCEFRNNKRYILSDMAFWNPAEIIGNNPHPLDYSLYKDIITHRAWNKGLVEMGYREVNEDLMYKFGNKPYISVDYSFESLIPADLNDKLAEKLTEYYRKKLSRDYSAHDKIEFEVVLSCYDFETEADLLELKKEGFTEKDIFDIRRSLFDITYNVIRKYENILEKDTEDLDRLEKARYKAEAIIEKENSILSCVQQMEKLLAAIKQYGTPQFARQARCAFIARSLCRTMISKGYITTDEHDKFMSTVSTVAKQFEIDYNKMLHNKISVDDFNKEYGHLRAGTYDIKSSRYDKMDLYSEVGSKESEIKTAAFSLPKQRVEKALADIGMSIRYEEFIFFIKNSIEQREYFKFIFTRSLSRVIEIIADIGKKLGFKRGGMAFLEIPQILSLMFYDDENDMRSSLKTIIETHYAAYTDNQKLLLPEIITSRADFNIVNIAESRPNFVTIKSVHAPVVILQNDIDSDIEGKIVVVEKADPGFDWIFSKGIVGLVTKYGGAASHMAIRCAEYEIPAAIGCGEKIFESIKNNSEITIDCKNGKIIGGIA